MAEQAAPGTIVGGRYELAEFLGQGGMGTVWRARDSVLRRDVVVKEVRLPTVLNPQEREVAVERSLREARAAALINHPNVITVYDVVRQDDRPWIVMEYLPCRTLEQVVDEEGPLAPGRAATIGLALLKGLQAAHRAGIQHRDVKPSNVLVRAEDQVVLTDFGIASIAGDRSLTRSGMLVGAPGYIAPERARGESGGPPADLWSLGATLYASVQGRPLFDRGSALATLTAIVTEEVELPASTGALRPVLQGLLRRDPDQRIDADRAVTLLRMAIQRSRDAAPDGAETDTESSSPDAESAHDYQLRSGADGWPTLVDEAATVPADDGETPPAEPSDAHAAKPPVAEPPAEPPVP
ncbi:MAG: serine/threonine-protein kinase, partial [Actinocatenispora sp.]